MAEYYSMVYIYPIFLSQSFEGGYLGCCHVFIISNSSAMNKGVHQSFEITVFIFSKYIPKSGTVESYGSLFSVL